MTITGRGAAIGGGALLGALGVFGFLLDSHAPRVGTYLFAAFVAPIVLFPATAVAAALDPEDPGAAGAAAGVLWPAYLGLVVCIVGQARFWIELAGQGSHENYAAIALVLVIAAHAASFGVIGVLLQIARRTRAAGIQVWLGIPATIAGWMLGFVF